MRGQRVRLLRHLRKLGGRPAGDLTLGTRSLRVPVEDQGWPGRQADQCPGQRLHLRLHCLPPGNHELVCVRRDCLCIVLQLRREGHARFGEQQVQEGGVCNYNTSLDYLRGNDNIWDYSAITCDQHNMGSVTFKGSFDMHYITYEQRQQSVTLNRVGGSCEEECRTVPPQWPSATSYGGRDWQVVHLDTELFLATKARHPTLSDVPNVHVQRPMIVGNKCRCYSFENAFRPEAPQDHRLAGR